MKNDIIPPRLPRPVSPAQPQQANPPVLPEPLQELPQAIDLPLQDNKTLDKKRRRPLWMIGAAVGVLLLGAVVAGILWYVSALRPVSSSAEHTVITIAAGTPPDMIARQLKTEGLIRSELAFALYTRQRGVQGSLQAGTYRLAPNNSLAEIVGQLLEGKAAYFQVTFYPGATLFDPTDTPDEKRTDTYTMLRRAGYSDDEIKKGLNANYDHPLLAGKPAGTSLEGYVYGETYQFNNGATVEQILTHTFDVFYERIQAAGIIDKLADVDMTLYEAMTLASIIEREVSGQLDDQKIVSQIFHKRLQIGEPLGADATFMYAAQQRNETPTINFNSPYNTRINKGLPPGPIASPSIVALQAAVTPADTDYLFFVSGDDGTNHFARTQAEHEANTGRYCTKLCNEIAH